MNNKTALKSIIKFLSKHDFYYCMEYEGIYEANECYCVDDLLQQAFDSIYNSVCGILGSYRITTEQLSDELLEDLTNEAYEEAEKYHIRFYNMKEQEAIEAINNNKELKQILFDRFTE